MSSGKRRKAESVPIRLDGDVHLWALVLKDALKAKNLSDALRIAIRKAYPNIDEIAKEAMEKDSEKMELLKRLLEESEDGE